MDFDPAIALGYARTLAQPRRVGTDANERVVAELSQQLTTLGAQVELQSFSFSAWAGSAAVLPVLALQILIVGIFWAWSLGTWAPVLPAALLLGLLAFSSRLYRSAAAASLIPPEGPRTGVEGWRRLQIRSGPVWHATNIVATLPARPGSVSHAPVYLMAHSDSKSQALSLVARMSLIGLAGVATALFGALTLLRPVFPAVTAAAALAGLVALVAGMPVLLLCLSEVGNTSPGAIDNASGAGLVLHLAECLRSRPAAIPVVVLITGAEELGLLGALEYVRRTGAAPLHEALILNFDGIGTDGRLALGGGRGGRLAGLVRKACNELGVPLGHLPLVGAQFDHLPFADAGLQALSLVTVGRAALSIHTAQDDAAKLHIDGFRRAGEVALRVLEMLEREGSGPANAGR